MELRNIEEAAHVKEEVGRGNLPASGSARYVCCGLLCAELLSRLPKNLSSSFTARNGEQHVNKLGSRK